LSGIGYVVAANSGSGQGKVYGTVGSNGQSGNSNKWDINVTFAVPSNAQTPSLSFKYFRSYSQNLYLYRNGALIEAFTTNQWNAVSRTLVPGSTYSLRATAMDIYATGDYILVDDIVVTYFQ
jgi:hypothetical protein